MRFVILTDVHFVPRGQTLFGMDPEDRLAPAVQRINRDHPEIDGVIVTGDLAHHGEAAAYRRLKATLDGLRAPVVLMLGNHDGRAPFRDVFPTADRDEHGFVQAARVYPDATVVTLDTLDEDGPTHAGRLCPHRLGYLRRALSDAPTDRPVLLFQHHPPMPLGLPHMDAIRLLDGGAEAEVWSATRRPDYLFFGHVHRPVAGVWQGVPFHAQRGTNHQVAFDLTTTDHIPGTAKPPVYALVDVSDGAVTVHQRSYLDDGAPLDLHGDVTAR